MTVHSQMREEIRRLRESNSDLLEALREIPDPEDEGFCPYCGERLELAKELITYKDKTVGERHFFKHTTCWYAKAQAAIRKAEGK